MCLVTYIPTETGYILSSNRDEHISRADTKIITEKLGGYEVTYPKDIKGGSWIFSSLDSKNVVLLNGAFRSHKRELPYKMSRGLMVKEIYRYTTLEAFIDRFSFDGIEPFTLIMNDQLSFLELRWDGSDRHIKHLDREKASVWSSCTLYNDERQALRKSLFETLISDQAYNLALAKRVHNHRGTLPPDYDFNMSLSHGVKTISSTYIECSSNLSRLFYDDKSV